MTDTLYSFPADALVARLTRNADFPSLGVAVSRVAALVQSDTSTVGELANLILSDVHLTQKVLRLANSVMFRRAAPPVTTVSKAVARIGSEQIRLIALSALLLERMANREKAALLSPQIQRALYASMLAHAVGPRVGADAEESAICAMFRSIGRLMIAMYESDCFAEVQRVARAGRIRPTGRPQGESRDAQHEGGPVGEAEAARQVTGGNFEQIGRRILEQWGIPETIVKTIVVSPPCPELPPGRVERLQVVSQFATSVAAAMHADGIPGRSAGIAAALASHGRALDLDARTLQDLLVKTSERTRLFAQVLDLEPELDEATVAADADLPQSLGIEIQVAADAPALDGGSRSAEGKPVAATALLLAGIQDMTAGCAEGNDLPSVLNIATETLQRGMGYQRALLCLRDTGSGGFRARMPFGFMPRERLQRFAFSGTVTSDLFWSVMLRNVDVHIRDLSTDAIQAGLPKWYRDACPDAKSFVLLPIVFKDRPLGFFYADRVMVDPVGLTPEELALVRMLKSQTLIALRSSAR